MQKNNNDIGASANDGKEQPKLINRSRIAKIRRQLKGAETRVERLKQELNDTRAVLKRGYIEKTNSKGVVTQIPLKPFERDTYRNKRVMIEQEFAVAQRDYLVADRAYKQAISNNFRTNRLKLKSAKKEIGIRRMSKKLLNKTLELVKKQANAGDGGKFRVLQSLAEASDVKGFRKAFDEFGPELNKELYYTVSGVNEVKTEILHELMEELAKKKADSPEATETK
jgi:hypothetical protein